MQRMRYFGALSFAVFGSVVVFQSAGKAQADDTKQAPALEGLHALGAATNGLRGGIRSSGRDRMVVFIQKTQSNIVLPRLDSPELNSVHPKYRGVSDAHRFGSLFPVWLGPTNGCCGLMELRDSAGRIVPVHKAGLNTLEAYPQFLHWHDLAPQLGGLAPHGITRLSRNLCCYGSAPFGGNETRAECLPFYLEDYFQVEQPGDYELTVWPRIYKRSEAADTEHDLFALIDIPPVTLRIRWANINAKSP
jgi:hypothetical protein